MHRIRTTHDLTILSCPWAADDTHRVNPKAIPTLSLDLSL
jgi:hypothetical protein